MAAATNISSSGPAPQVTINGGNLIRYTFRFFLFKPVGQKWPGTNSRKKKIHQVTLNKNHPPTDTFSLGDPDDLRNLSLSWVVDMIVPGGGGPLQYTASVEITQDGSAVMDPPWSDQGDVTNTLAIGNSTELRVTP